MSELFAGFPFVPVVALLVLLWVAILSRKGWRGKTGFADKEEDGKRTWLGGSEEGSFRDRRVTLKFCPDCRELVFLDARVCRYCGCAQSVADTTGETAASEQRLAISKEPKQETKQPSATRLPPS